MSNPCSQFEKQLSICNDDAERLVTMKYISPKLVDLILGMHKQLCCGCKKKFLKIHTIQRILNGPIEAFHERNISGIKKMSELKYISMIIEHECWIVGICIEHTFGDDYNVSLVYTGSESDIRIIDNEYVYGSYHMIAENIISKLLILVGVEPMHSVQSYSIDMYNELSDYFYGSMFYFLEKKLYDVAIESHGEHFFSLPITSNDFETGISVHETVSETLDNYLNENIKPTLLVFYKDVIPFLVYVERSYYGYVINVIRLRLNTVMQFQRRGSRMKTICCSDSIISCGKIEYLHPHTVSEQIVHCIFKIINDGYFGKMKIIHYDGYEQVSYRKKLSCRLYRRRKFKVRSKF